VYKTDKKSPLFHTLKEIPHGQGGGKAQGLKFLMDLGLAVPKSLVLHQELGSMDDAESILAEFEDVKLAVRSSSVNEDQVGFSAAGQYETKLNIENPEELIKAVEICRNSGNSERVKTYQKNKSSQSDNIPISIPLVIQEMISPKWAGVLFTMNPVTGSRGHYVIEATDGPGEKVVDGTALTSSYKIDRNGFGIECSGKSILSEKILKELETGAELAERKAGYPLDLEWAVDEKGKLWWLQSRPVTTLDREQLNSIIRNDRWVITTGNIGEVFPGSTTPLTYSTAGIALDVGMQEMYKQVGVPLDGGETDFFIHYYDNHLFFMMNNIWIMPRYVMGASEDQMDLSICGTIVENRGRLLRKTNIFRRSFNLFRYMNVLLNPDIRLKEMAEIVSEFQIPLLSEAKGSIELYNRLTGEQELLNHVYYLHYCISGHSALMNILLEKSVKDKNLILQYMTDIPDIESALIPKALNTMAEAILTLCDVDSFTKMNSDEQLQWIMSKKKIADLWTGFMDDHGHRSIKELEMRETEWRVSPELILTNLSGIVRSCSKGNIQSENRVIPNEKDFPKAARNARNGVRKRERSKSLLVKFQNKYKAGWRQLAVNLVNMGLLPHRDMIYFLTCNEIGSLLSAYNKNEKITEYQSLAEKRKKQFEENDLIHFPRISYGRPLPVIHEDSDLTSTYGSSLKGIPVSKGVYTGIVRIVRTRSDADELQRGEIMVSTFTDIGWSPYYSITGGLITELGSPLSHGAVVAREYGVPLVSCVQNATKILKTGDIVRVNGTSGTVEIISEDK